MKANKQPEKEEKSMAVNEDGLKVEDIESTEEEMIIPSFDEKTTGIIENPVADYNLIDPGWTTSTAVQFDDSQPQDDIRQKNPVRGKSTGRGLQEQMSYGNPYQTPAQLLATKQQRGAVKYSDQQREQPRQYGSFTIKAAPDGPGLDAYSQLRKAQEAAAIKPLSKEDSNIENNISHLEKVTAESNKHAKRTKDGLNIPPSYKKPSSLSKRNLASPPPVREMGYEFQSREEVLLFIGFADFLKIKHNLNPTKFNLRLKLMKDFHYIVTFKKKEFHAQLIRGHSELNKFYGDVRMRVSLMDGLLNAGYQDKFFTEYLSKANTFYNISLDGIDTINIDGHIISKGVFECMVEDSYPNFMENVLYEDSLSIEK